MQTAVTPVNASEIQFNWAPKPQDKNPGFIAAMHFAEFQILSRKDLREFDIFLNDWKWNKEPLSPPYLYSGFVYGLNPYSRYSQYNVSITATNNSTLPPILNALEVFTVLYTTEMSTDSGDVNGMMAIKAWYGLKRNWMGDPCSPKAFAWDGLNCSYATSHPPRITSLNLTSSGLTGGITTSFVNLTSLQYLDLSHNNLTGTIPDELSQLPSIIFLDLTSNQLNGSIPVGLLKRSQDGSLTLRIGDNKDLCANDNSCVPAEKKKSSIILIVVIVLVVVMVLFLVVVLTVCIRRNGLSRYITVGPDIYNPFKEMSDYGDSSLQLENRQFSYKELVAITSNFSREIGKGGFGKVFDGFLENGAQVAVKMRSHTSSQGVKEFLAEAQHLARVHHKNLVAMIGYCKDGDYLGLVYEYMSEGTLQDHLTGKAHGGRPLSWKQRLRITLESAQGLEYLHKGCKPPLIHRDVKTNNILLTANLEAKIADFGLSKAFDSDRYTHVSTAVVGTPGYLDPEYYATFQLSEKSDVYSFGVILLEIITGKPPILSGTEPVHIIHWVHQRLDRGIIESVIDPSMQGEYNVNSVWKVTDLALKCTAQSPNQRPTMTDVVEQLKESLELEGTDERGHAM
ncbi:putative leucine-rich repeat receptor-like serine/threonine-protein kinase At2g19230 [Typha angustifolia]|uniref:putative leucine-rich repeat receptor-like serine/threonine-protein kinase At2g19230 n=1 Tax=Typha angustifolia TaxID=59011 RepID=UPI003C2B9FFB